MEINKSNKNAVQIFFLSLVGHVHPLANSVGPQQINSLKHELEATFFQDLTSCYYENDTVW